MTRQTISPWDFAARGFTFWDRDWLLLSAGDFTTRKFNSMTVSWGFLGVMWGRPMAIVVVRPQRYTREFMERAGSFTLCAFSKEYRKVLDVLGTKSGREMDKINASGVTAMAATKVSAPVFEEAQLAIECKKVYTDDFKPERFLADYIAGMYKGDFHRMYFGEVVAVSGTEAYRAEASMSKSQ